jgi:hypothetical protein
MQFINEGTYDVSTRLSNDTLFIFRGQHESQEENERFVKWFEELLATGKIPSPPFLPDTLEIRWGTLWAYAREKESLCFSIEVPDSLCSMAERLRPPTGAGWPYDGTGVWERG